MSNVPMPPSTAPEDAIYCVACGYDLRGLPETSQCPDCGRPIKDSWRARDLGPPRSWRQITAHGLLICIVGGILAGFVPLGGVIPRFLDLFYYYPALIWIIYLALPAVAALLVLIGGFLITRPERPGQRTTAAHWLRSVVWVSIVMFIFICPAEMISYFIRPGRYFAWGMALQRWADALEHVGIWLNVAWAFFLMAFVANLARRALHMGLARQARILQGLLPLLVVMSWWLGLDDMLLTPPRRVPVPVDDMLRVYLPYVLMFVASLWQLIVLWRVAGLLRRPRPLLADTPESTRAALPK